jgi:acetyl esterase/lipase
MHVFNGTTWRFVQSALTACALGLAACASSEPVSVASGPEEVAIWPDGTPDAVPTAAETISPQDHGWRQIQIIKNVSTPTVTIIRPPAGRANGSAMIILPGGAFGALAWDLEGIEVGEFLAERGVTAFVLKYRVRDATPEGIAEYMRDPRLERMLELLEPGRARAAQDAMQAVRFVRANAARYGVDTDRVGMMGFSAGAITTARVLHEADAQSAPNIAAPIYGVMLEEGVPAHTPPLFVAIARDDGLFTMDQIDALSDTWERVGAPIEVHVFETGGHGFGLGRPDTESARFPELFEAWLRERGFITGAR